MKLYATTTSERASKGQGGQYLTIKITNESKKVLWTMFIKDEILNVYKNDSFKVIFKDWESKGEKKKDEVNRCIQCNKKLPEEWTGYCYECNEKL